MTFFTDVIDVHTIYPDPSNIVAFGTALKNAIPVTPEYKIIFSQVITAYGGGCLYGFAYGDTSYASFIYFYANHYPYIFKIDNGTVSGKQL